MYCKFVYFLALLWPNVKQDEINRKFLLFLTDSAAYMIKAGKNLKKLYKNLLHITCVAHGLHRVAEKVRALYPQVDKLVSSVKKVFRKAPARVVYYREVNPEISLPPEPCTTRWGTWLDAVEFYSKNLESVKNVVNAFDPEDAACIRQAQKVLSKPALSQQVAFISANFNFLSDSIRKVETHQLTLVEYVDIIVHAESKLKLRIPIAYR